MDSAERSPQSARFNSLMRAVACIDPVAPETCAGLLPVGERLAHGRFEIQRVLGTGGMGVVYAAWDATLQHVVALKVAQLTTAEHTVRLREEYAALLAVHHSGLVQPHELFTEGDRTFFTMELVEGSDFTAACGSVAPVRNLAVDLIEIVAALHEAGRVHRDLKPDNVLVTSDGEVRVIDLGLARAIDSPAWFDSSDAGTERYRAPEVRRGLVTTACDMYAVGVLLQQALREPAVREQAVREGRDDAPVAALAQRLVHSDPERRPSARQALAELAGRPVEVVRPRHVVGRRAELEQCEAALSSHRVVYLHAAPGMGKTALLDVLARRLDGVVVRAVCEERDSRAFKAFDAVAHTLAEGLASGVIDVQRTSLSPRAAAALAAAFPELAMALRLQPSSTEAERSWLVTGLVTLFSAFEGTPVTFFIDDFQWCDDDGRRLLLEVMRAAPALRWVVAARELPREWPRSLGFAPIALGPLAKKDAERLVRSLGPTDDEHVARAVASHAGSPLGLIEWVRRIDRYGGSLERALVNAARDLPATPRRVLELLAVAGETLPRVVVRDAVRATDAAIERAARTLRRDDWALTVGKDELGLLHDTVRRALVEELSASNRADVHRQLASAFERQRPHAHDALASHWLGAGDTTKGRRHALLAARSAFRRSAFAHAQERYRLALSLGLESDDRGDVELELAHALAADGRPLEAASAYLRAARLLQGHAGVLARRGAVVQQLVGGDIESGMAALGRVFTEAGLRPPRAGLRSSIAAMLHERMRLALEGWPRRWLSRGALMPDELERIDLLFSVGTALSFFDGARALTMQTQCLRRLLGTDEVDRLARSWAHEAMVGAVRDGPKAGRAILQRAAARRTPRDARVRVIVDSADQVVSLCEGRFEAAVSTHDGVLRFIREEVPGTPAYEMASGFLLRALACWYLGDADRLREAVTLARREIDQRGDEALRALMDAFPAPALALLDGDHDAARRIVRSYPSDDARRVGAVHGLRLSARAMLAIADGDADAACAHFGARSSRGALAYGSRSALSAQDLAFWRATAALAALPKNARHSTVVNESIVVLLRSTIPWAASLAHLLGAQLAFATTPGERGRRNALSLLARSQVGFEAHRMRLFAGAAHRAQERLRGASLDEHGRPTSEQLDVLAPAFTGRVLPTAPPKPAGGVRAPRSQSPRASVATLRK